MGSSIELEMRPGSVQAPCLGTGRCGQFEVKTFRRAGVEFVSPEPFSVDTPIEMTVRTEARIYQVAAVIVACRSQESGGWTVSALFLSVRGRFNEMQWLPA